LPFTGFAELILEVCHSANADFHADQSGGSIDHALRRRRLRRSCLTLNPSIDIHSSPPPTDSCDRRRYPRSGSDCLRLFAITDAAAPKVSATKSLLLTPPVLGNVGRGETQIRAVDDITEALGSSAHYLPAGITRIYFWITYSAMTDGAAWTRLLLRDGEPIQGGGYLWSGGETGTAAYFFGDAEGFPPGEYTLRLLLADQPVSEMVFIVE
jgi:hypothetical protein